MLNEVSVNCPLEKVFSFLAAPEKFPLWNYYLRSVQKVQEGNPVIGARYHQQRVKDEQNFSVTAFEKNKYIEYSSTGGTWLKFKRRFNVSMVNSVCIVEDRFEIRTFLPSFINSIIAKKPAAAVKENLLKLKELLETGTTVLQDNRRITLA